MLFAFERYLRYRPTFKQTQRMGCKTKNAFERSLKCVFVWGQGTESNVDVLVHYSK